MKKLLAILLVCGMIFSLAACGSTPDSESAESGTENSSVVESQTESETPSDEAEPSESTPEAENTSGNALVAYFAYSENIGDTSGMSVDAIASASLNQSTDNTEGNLQVMAQVIQEQTGADVHSILVQEPYDPDYDTMRERAYEELDNASFPELQSQVDNLDDYNVVYLGTPVWSGNMPRPVASFLQENDLSGKTIVPFGINLGSRFGTIIQEIEELCPDATVLEGFTISASTANDEVRTEVADWLSGLQLN